MSESFSNGDNSSSVSAASIPTTTTHRLLWVRPPSNIASWLRTSSSVNLVASISRSGAKAHDNNVGKNGVES